MADKNVTLEQVDQSLQLRPADGRTYTGRPESSRSSGNNSSSEVASMQQDIDALIDSSSDDKYNLEKNGLNREVVVECELSCTKGQPLRIQQKMEDALRLRKEHQPLGKPSCGGVFRNPEGASAGKLIEQVGLKGFCMGGAQISPVHANFIVNTGNATAADVAGCMKRARDGVMAAYGIELRPEVRFLGFD
jgi:UDP-N-acetylenolpyruvoylglucosamine reductase